MRALVFWLAAGCMVAPAGARAQTATAFTQKALCTADAKLDVGKFLVVAINDASLDLSKVMVDGSRIDNDKLHALVADAPSVILFEDQYLNAPNPYFKVVTRPDARVEVEVIDVLQRPAAYAIKCLNYPPPETAARQCDLAGY